MNTWILDIGIKRNIKDLEVYRCCRHEIFHEEVKYIRKKIKIVQWYSTSGDAKEALKFSNNVTLPNTDFNFFHSFFHS